MPPRAPPPKCGGIVPLGSLRPGIEASVVLCILLGMDRAHEVALRSGEFALVTSLYLADPTAELGMELRVWGVPGIRLAHLRPLDVLHVPAVSLRRSKSGIPSLSTRAPQYITQFQLPGQKRKGAPAANEAASNCPCAQSEIAQELARWTNDRHAALRNVPLRPAPPETGPPAARPRLGRMPQNATAASGDALPTSRTEDGACSSTRTLRARVTAVRLRAPRAAALAESLATAVADVCGACGASDTCSCAFVPRKRVLSAAVRVEFAPVRAPNAGGADGELVVAQCEGDDLARLLLSTPAEIAEDGGTAAAAVLRALSADSGVFDAVLEDGGGPLPLLRYLRF